MDRYFATLRQYLDFIEALFIKNTIDAETASGTSH